MVRPKKSPTTQTEQVRRAPLYILYLSATLTSLYHELLLLFVEVKSPDSMNSFANLIAVQVDYIFSFDSIDSPPCNVRVLLHLLVSSQLFSAPDVILRFANH